ncbi:hypothetical protein GCM10009646_72020 [Streptomyces aureus]
MIQSAAASFDDGARARFATRENSTRSVTGMFRRRPRGLSHLFDDPVDPQPPPEVIKDVGVAERDRRDELQVTCRGRRQRLARLQQPR